MDVPFLAAWDVGLLHVVVHNRRAFGNGYTRERTKRFWTDCHYHLFREGKWQVGWVKEEPVLFIGRGVSDRLDIFGSYAPLSFRVAHRYRKATARPKAPGKASSADSLMCAG